MIFQYNIQERKAQKILAGKENFSTLLALGKTGDYTGVVGHCPNNTKEVTIMPRIRMAEEKDAAALLDIYRPYIATTVTFEYEVPTVEEFTRRVRHTLEHYPYLLCEENGKVLGYAYAHRARERAAYQWDAELSVYISGDEHGRGIGRALYSALMELVAAQGVRNFYGVITGENTRSIRFHEELGFTLAGVHHRTGYKNGKWLDVVDMERCLEGVDPPAPVRGMDVLTEQQREEILCRYAKTIR